MRRRILLMLGIAVSPLIGCGGSAPAGNVEVRIDWPSRGRYVAPYVNSLRAVVTTPTNRQYTLVINRIGDNPYTGGGMFTQPIPVGTHTLAVDAFTAPDAQGSLVGTATLQVTVVKGQVTTVNISANLQSTIVDIVIEGQPLTVRVEESVQLSGYARDAQQQTLLLPPGALVWSISAGNSHATVTPLGLLSGVSVGQATVKLEEPGAAISGTANVTVLPIAEYIVFDSDRSGNLDVFVMNVDGSGQTNLTNHPAADWTAQASPDGTKIAFTSDRSGSPQIYVMNRDGTNVTRLTFSGAHDGRPRWSPDGQRIVFNSNATGVFKIYIMNANGSGITQLTFGGGFTDGGQQFSPDGQKISFETHRDGNYEVYVMNTDGSTQTRLTDNPAFDGFAAWSPDGSYMLFCSNRSGDLQIWRMNTNGSNPVQITNLSGDNRFPEFNRAGTQVIFDRLVGGNREVVRIQPDGSGFTNLSNHPSNDESPTYGGG